MDETENGDFNAPLRLLTSSEVSLVLRVSYQTLTRYVERSHRSSRGVGGSVLSTLRPVAVAGRGGRIKLFAAVDVKAIAERLGLPWPADIAA